MAQPISTAMVFMRVEKGAQTPLLKQGGSGCRRGVGRGRVGMGSVADSRLSPKKAPLASWVTLGRQIDVKPASDRTKPSRFEQTAEHGRLAMTDFFPELERPLNE